MTTAALFAGSCESACFSEGLEFDRTLERAGATSATAEHLDDWTLLERAKTEARLFGTLFERHRDYVFRLAWALVGEGSAEDVLQEVFARVLQRRRPWLRQAKFTTVLYQITLNTAREIRRGTKREVPTGGRVLASLHHQAEGAARPRDPALTDLARALMRLADRQREVVVMRHLEGLSTRETARILRCSEGTIKTHLHRGLAALRAHLGGEADAAVGKTRDEELSP